MNGIETIIHYQREDSLKHSITHQSIRLQKKKKEESQSTLHTLNTKQKTDTMLTLTVQDTLTMLRT